MYIYENRGVYIGHKIDAEGIHLTTEKVAEIGKAPYPTCMNKT